MIVCFVDIGGIVDHTCLEVDVRFVDIGGTVYHRYLEVDAHFVDIGGIVDRHCINILFIMVMATSKYNHKKMKKKYW